MTLSSTGTTQARDIKTRSQNGYLWPTPIVTVFLEGSEQLNARLANIILEQEQKIVGKGKSTEVAGIKDGLSAYWLNFNVLNWDYPEIAEFRRIVLEGVREWLKMVDGLGQEDRQLAGISCWANVLRYGERLTIHHHDPAFVSAHYTVQSGSDGNSLAGDSGYTVYYRPGFMDRSHGGEAFMAPSPWDDDWRIEKRPVEGRLLLFPSFIRHEVRPYLGQSQRISIAMDIFLKRQKLPIFFGGPRWFVPR